MKTKESTNSFYFLSLITFSVYVDFHRDSSEDLILRKRTLVVLGRFVFMMGKSCWGNGIYLDCRTRLLIRWGYMAG
jgi:hypothetical protein